MAETTTGGGGGGGIAVGALTLPITSVGLADIFRDLDRIDARALKTGGGGVKIPVTVAGLADATRAIDGAEAAAKGLGEAVVKSGTSGAAIMDDLFGATERETQAVKENTAAVKENAAARETIPGGELPGAFTPTQNRPADTHPELGPGTSTATTAQAIAMSEAAVAAQAELAAATATVIAGIEAEALAVEVTNKTAVAGFKKSVAGATEQLQAINADTAAYERLGAAVLDVTTRAAAAGTVGAKGADKQADALKKIPPQARSAANGLTVLAMAATMGTGSVQGIAMAAGLAASSIATMTDNAKVAAWASGIGAAVTVVAVLAGVLAKAGEASKPTERFLDRLARFGTEDQARGQLAAIDAEITRLEAHAERGKGLLNRLLTGGEAAPNARGLERALQQLGLSDADRQQIATLLEQRRAVVKRANELGNADAEAAGQAHAEIRLEHVRAENAAADALGEAAMARETARYATGRTTLDAYYADRLAAIRAAGAREVAALDAERGTLAVGPTGESETEKATREAALARVTTQIRAAEARTTGQITAEYEARRTAREALDKAVLGFEQKEADAAGDSSAQRTAQIQNEVRDYARALVQQGKLTQAAADERARAFGEALTAGVTLATAQTASTRALASLDLERLAIQQRMARGDLTAQEGSAALAALERERLPILTKIADEAVRAAEATGNPDAVAAAKRARAELAALGVDQELVAFGESLESGIASTISGAISGGFAAAVQSGSIGAGFKAVAGGFLQGLGGLFITIGERSLAGMLFIKKIVDAILGLNPVMGIAASLGLIALGGILQGLGGRASGGGGVGGGGTASAGVTAAVPNTQITLGSGFAANPRPVGSVPTAVVPGAAPANAPTPVHIASVTVLNPGDPTWQRQLSESVTLGVRRGLSYGGKG